MGDVLPVLVVLTVLKHAWTYVIGRSERAKRAEMRPVGTLSGISVFPVKSMRAVKVDQALCNYDGLIAGQVRDRCFMVVDSKLTLLSARRCSKLAAVTATQQADVSVTLKAPGREPFIVPVPDPDNSQTLDVVLWEEGIPGLDCGPAVGRWLDSALDRTGLRLVYSAPGMVRRKCLDGDSEWHKLSKPQDQVTFQDGFPYMLLGEGSLEDLNSRLKTSVNMDNFRPNLVVKECGPYAEDTWDKLHIGEATFTNIKPCERCIMTTVSTESGKKDPNMEPLRTLKKYRKFGDSPFFGVNLVVDQPGTVCVGDTVYATLK